MFDNFAAMTISPLVEGHIRSLNLASRVPGPKANEPTLAKTRVVIPGERGIGLVTDLVTLPGEDPAQVFPGTILMTDC